MPKYLINKVFIELRYNESLMFNDMKCLQEIANELISVLKNYKYDSEAKALLLSNDDNNLNVSIFNNRLIIDQDEVSSLESFKKFSNEILSIVTSKLCIANFVRSGMRILKGIEVKNLKEANTYIKKNYIKINDNDFNILGDNQNVRVIFNSIFDDFGIALSISPNLFQVINIVDGNIKRNIQTPQILIDADIFIEKTTDSARIVECFIDDVIRYNYNKVDKFIGKVNIY